MNEVRRAQNEWAIEQLNRWASVLNDGALYYPGPADLNQNQEIACRVTLDDMAAFELVNAELGGAQSIESMMKNLLIHVHWKGEPLETFRALQPGEQMPRWIQRLGLGPKDVCLHAYRGFVNRLIRRGAAFKAAADKPLTGQHLDKIQRNLGVTAQSG